MGIMGAIVHLIRTLFRNGKEYCHISLRLPLPLLFICVPSNSRSARYRSSLTVSWAFTRLWQPYSKALGPELVVILGSGFL